MKLEELEKLFKKVEGMITECIYGGLSDEMMLLQGLPKIKAEYGLDEKYYKQKLKQLEDSEVI